MQNIVINHSADIDYKNFMKIYKECAKEPYFFWQLILDYQQVILYNSEKICFFLVKMTIADQPKILDQKIMQNEAQYDLDRKAAIISVYSSNELDKYEYLTGEDLNLKPSTVEQAWFEYSPLCKFLNRGLKEEDKKEGLLKRLKNIKEKSKEKLEVFSKANKTSRLAKNERDYNYKSKFAFYGFYRDFEKFKIRSLRSKYNDIIELWWI